jgi:hypothetical protein
MRLFALLVFAILAFTAEAQRIDQEAMKQHAISFKLCMFNDAPVMWKCLKEYRTEATKTLRNDRYAEFFIDKGAQFLERQSYAYYDCLRFAGVTAPPILKEQHETCWASASIAVYKEDAARAEREQEEKRQTEQREKISNLIYAAVLLVVSMVVLVAIWKAVIARLEKKKNSEAEQWRFILLMVTSALLLFAVADLPYGYYTFLRIVACGAFAFSAFTYADSNKIITTVFAIGAIIFNPLIPIHMDKDEWIVIDLAAAAFSASVALCTKFRMRKVSNADKSSVKGFLFRLRTWLSGFRF